MLVYKGGWGEREEGPRGRNRGREGRRQGRKGEREGGREGDCLPVTVKGSLRGTSSLPLPTAPPQRACDPVRMCTQLPVFQGSATCSVGGRSLSWAVHILLGRWACSDALTVVSALTGSIHHAGPLCQRKSMVTCSKGCSQQTKCLGLNRWYFWNI